MGSLIGHVLPGIAFLALGLWHFFNNIKLHTLKANSFTSSPWFPVPKVRYLELILIMVGSFISISFELFIGPERHQPLDLDGTIPSNHLHNFEHSIISMSFIVYSTFAILLDKTRPKLANGTNLTILLGAIAFGLEFFLFHVHSTDHEGVEGQYHLLLQLLIAISMATTLMAIGLPKSFLISFVRSVSIFFQGIWFIVMGVMLWTPSLTPKGCSINSEDGHKVVRCASEEALYRAKSLVNILFSVFVLGITIFGMSFYLSLVEFYRQKVDDHSSLMAKEFEEETKDDESDNVEPQKKYKQGEYGGIGFSPLQMSM